MRSWCILRKQTASRKSLKVKIPAGIDTGKIIRDWRGKGMPKAQVDMTEYLLLKVQVGTKAGFERKEMDVIYKAMIPFTTAVLGGEVIVQTLYGKVLCTIRPEHSRGQRFGCRAKESYR